MKKLAKVILCLLAVCMFHFQGICAEETEIKEEEVLTDKDVEAVSLKSENAIFINLNDDRILYSKNAKQRIYPASMTKIMTTLVAIENIGDLDARCIITDEMLAGLKEANASVAGFQVGESVTYRDLLYGVMLPSGADASKAIAFSIFQDEAGFVKAMNTKAKQLHLMDTHFVNVSGLHDDHHYSTVEDISLLLKVALQNDLFKQIFTTTSYQCENGLTLYATLSSQAKKFQLNTDMIKGAKTGFTNEASLCLASYSEHEGERFIMVSAQTHSDNSYPYHIEDAIHLYDYVFSNYARVKVIKKGEVIKTLPVKWSSISNYELNAKKDVSLFIKNDEIGTLKKKFVGLKELEAPLFLEDVVGSYLVYEGDNVIYSMDVCMQEPIEKNEFLYYLSNIDAFFIDFKYMIGLFLMACAAFYAYHLYKKQT